MRSLVRAANITMLLPQSWQTSAHSLFVRHLAGTGLASAQRTLSDKWDEHVKYEFATRDTASTITTMVEDSYVNHVPVMTGGVGHTELTEFYSKRFIPQMPPDTNMTPVS